MRRRWPSPAYTARTDTLPPGAAAVLVPALAATIAVLIALSRPRFRGVLDAMPLTALVLAQSFRFPVEIVLAMLAEARLIPQIMTYHGTNFDILTGLTAPLAAGAALLGWRRSVLAWNILGLALVINVAGTAMLSFSGPTNVIKVTPPADFVVTFPLVWLPAFLVPVALLLHGLAIIKVRRLGGSPHWRLRAAAGHRRRRRRGARCGMSGEPARAQDRADAGAGDGAGEADGRGGDVDLPGVAAASRASSVA